jgi:hypothetical protein
MDKLPDHVDRQQLVKELKAQRSRFRARVPNVEVAEERQGGGPGPQLYAARGPRARSRASV